MNLPAVLTVDEAADLLRVDRRSVYGLIRSGDLHAVRVGRALRVPRWAIEHFLGAPPGENDEPPAGAGGAVRGLGDPLNAQSIEGDER